ncbi:MAG: hypothetical protein K8U57_38550 [Planctomycetes bacterium]|nr:hypothetical protein [Planctomycetota bacterium]
MTEEKWMGIGKLTEEAGEVLQLIGKLIPFPDGEHPDGKENLRDRLTMELYDLRAAIHYFMETNQLWSEEGEANYQEKLRKFNDWGLTGIKP